MSVPCFQVDAFSDGPFTGNPAAVCLLSQEASPTWMQSVAAEMNLAETAFASPMVPGGGQDASHEVAWKLRWFTPKVEVNLCGHATLAAAYALYATGAATDHEPITFSTASGTLSATRIDDNGRTKIELDFPECAAVATDTPSGLSAALGVEIGKVLDNGTDLLVELPNEAQVRALQPDFVALGRVESSRGIIVTSQSDHDDYDFVSRFFAPAVGIDEDPVTGSAHCCLAPYWSSKLGRRRMVGYQASPRGGFVEVELEPAPQGAGRVKLRGNAELIFRGELLVDPQ